ncbi:MAG: histidine kinase [Chitinophagaceae bacterium]|nr:histidine kinase [Chitinophagaceae bacterium]
MKQVIDFFEKLFLADSWPPRWYCGEWTSFHGWLYICSDLAIWLAYFAIPILLIKFVTQKRDVPLPSVFWLFGAFILLCGLTHAMDASMFWWPAYRLNGLIRFITACVSWLTVLALIKILPQAFTLKTTKELEVEIAARKEAEKKLNQYTAELEDKNKELEQFAYVASHDLQEPLRTISNYVGLIDEKLSETIDQETERHLQFIVSATAKMQNLIRDLLELSRIGKDVVMTTVDCNQLLASVLSEMQVTIEESHTSIISAVLPTLRGNETALKQLFQNLISNAIKFRKKNEPLHIHVSVEEKESEYLFAIKDNGIGIEEQHKEKIFIIFQRLHSEYPGTGIGLATCQKIVALHNGKIAVESKVGEGSVFYFSLSKKI